MKYIENSSNAQTEQDEHNLIQITHDWSHTLEN